MRASTADDFYGTRGKLPSVRRYPIGRLHLPRWSSARGVLPNQLPSEDISAREDEVARELNGTLDGVFEGNLSLAVPAKNGMNKINEFFDRFREKTGIQWYYANIYKNLDDDDETLLNWWLDS